MGWNSDGKTYTQEELTKLLEDFEPQYLKISKAPQMPVFDHDYQEEAWAVQHREILYKSVDKFGNVYLVTNPSAWKYKEEKSGNRRYFRPEPKKIATYAELKAGKSNQKKLGDF